MIVFSRPRFAHSVLRSSLFIGLLGCCLLIGDTLQSDAQTAHFGGSTKLVQAMNYPEGIALDAAGNLFVLTVPGTGNGVPTQVSEVAADGTVVPAINLGGYTLTSAFGLALDSSGYLYIVDNLQNGTSGSRVLKMKTDGTSASVVPTGPLTSPGNVAVDGSGNVYVEDNNITDNTSRIVKVPCTNGTYGTAFDFVSSTESIGSGGVPQYIDAVAVDASGNVLLTDIGPSSGRLIKVTPSGTPTELIPYTTSISGGTLLNPYGVQADAQGNIFIADWDSNFQGRLVELPYSAGSYGTPFEYVSASSGIIGEPVSLAIDAKGNLYVSDSESDALTSNAGGGVIEISTASVNFGKVPVATTTPPTRTLNFTFDTAGAIGTPTVVTQGASNKDFTDAGTGTCTTTNGAGHSYAAGSTCTVDVKFNPKVSGSRYGAVTLLNTSGNPIATAYVYGTGQAPQVTFSQISNQVSNPSVTNLLGGGWVFPQGVAVDGTGNVFVADTTMVKKIPVGCGNNSCVIPVASNFSFYNLPAIAVDGSGNVFVAEYSNNKIYEIVAAGGYTVVNTLGGGFSFSSPTGVALDGSGNVYVADYSNNAVEEILAAGGYTTVTTLGGDFSLPQGVAVDGTGNVYVADTNHNAVKEIPPGCVTASCVVSLGGGFSGPVGVTVDGNGNIYIGDTNSNAVKQMPAGCGSTSCVVTLGSGFGAPQGVAVDGSGNVYVADSGNLAVKVLDFADPPSLNFATPTLVGSVDTTDGAKTVTVSNIGNQQLTFTSPTSGSNPSYPGNFPKNSADANLCVAGAPLAAGASCDVSANFLSIAVGSNAGSVMLTDDALNVTSLGATQSISLSGTGVTPDPTSVTTSASPSSMVSGQPVQLTAVVVDITNPSSVPAGTVTFTDTVGSTPTTLGTVTMVGHTATYSYSPAVGTHTITSVYTPTASSSFAASNDTVGAAFTVAAYGAVVRFSVTVAGNPAYVGTAGTVTVTALDINGNTVANYAGPVTLSSTDPGAVFSAVTFTNGVGTATVTFATIGSQTVIATAGSPVGTSASITVKEPPTFLVTTLTDMTIGTAANCTDQSLSGATPDADCSLRDAIAAANAVNGATTVAINFAPGLASPVPGVITLGNGQLELSDTSLVSLVITGPGANVLSISGNQASRIFSIDSGVKAVISGLTLTNGTTSDVNGGGAVYVLGNLTLNNEVFSNNVSLSGINGGAIAVGNNANLTATQCTFANNSSAANGGAININATAVALLTGSTFSGNTAAVSGGAIGTAGTVQITNSTLTGNTATTARGGAIYNTQNASLTLTHATVVGNSSSTFGGAVYVNSGTVTLKNSLVIGNSSGSYPDIYPSYVDNGGNIANGGSGTSTSSANLSSLSNYGGSTQTMVPLPGSPAICAGTSVNTSGISDDQRGLPRTTTYGSTSCVDAGAVQSNYSLSFTTEPGPIFPAATIAPGANFQAAMTLDESGAPFVPAVSVPLTLTGSGTLTNGTASTTNGVASYSTLQVSASGVGDTLTANLTLNGALVPPLAISAVSSMFTVEQLTASTAVASTTLTQNHAAVPFTPVTESGGIAPITYAVSPTLPTGLSMTASTGAITGTPTVTSSATSYTVTATDSNGATGTATFSLTVDSFVTATQAVASAALTVNHAITPFTPVTGAGGAGTLSYSVSPTLPTGLSMASATGAITGTSTTTSNATTYTVTVTDSNGATGTATFSLTVNGGVTATQAVASATLTQNHAATSFTPVTGAGGVGTLSYSVSPALPTGLSMASPTGTITGTPTATNNTMTYTVTVTDSNGATGTATFSLTVNNALTATQAVASTIETVNTAAAAFIPVTGSGGTSPVNYSVSPALPAGLALAPGTGTITGTPSIVTPAATYTVTVTDTNGATATASFSLTVNAETATIAISVPTHTYGDAPFNVNASSPSSGAFTYSVVSGPATISGSTITLTGIGTVQLQVSEAADANYAAATATASFTVLVAAPTLSFGTIAPQMYGNAPFSVSASSVSTGAVTYAVVSGPATISGHTVTLTGAGTIVLSATQAADGNYTAATATTSVAVNKTAPAVTLNSTLNPVLVTNPVILMATVSSGISVPTGTVSFYDGSSNVALGTSPVMTGVAMLSISSLAEGVHSITAVYSGDANFVTLTSSALSETVQDFSLTLSTSPGNTPTQTVAPGTTAIYALTASPINGTVFPGIVSFTASGLPPGATAIFSPQTLPAGSGSTPVTLSIQTAASTASLKQDHRFGGGFAPVALGILLLPFSTRLRRSARKLGRAGSFAALLLLLIGGLAGVAGLTGCGASNGFLGQSPKNYTITVTATSGTLQHTSTVILNLQ